MIAIALLIIFIFFAALMFTRKMPALLALPSMAILIALVARLPLEQILQQIVAQGCTKLAPVYVAVFMGAMMGRSMMQTHITEALIKRAAEFGGEQPFLIALGLMLVTTILFTTLQGLGGIISVGSLVLPIMMSLSIPRKLAGTLFLLSFGTGFIFNPILFSLYRQLLHLDAATPMPTSIAQFALILFGLMLINNFLYAYLAARRSGDLLLMSAPPQSPFKKQVAWMALFTPLVPLGLYFGFSLLGLKLDFISAFIIGSLYAVLSTQWRDSIKILTASAIKGIEDGAPAALLMMGIGMLLNALNLEPIKQALEPLIRSLPFQSPLFYLLFFGLLSPLALYRGPFNIFGIGIGMFSIMFGTGVIPPYALLAAIMCIVQVQNICDPTNTHNVWIAHFIGTPVESLTKETLLPIFLVCMVGLIVSCWMFF